MDFARAQLCEMGHVIRDVLLRMLYLAHKFGPHVLVVLSKLDVKQAFGRDPIDPARVTVFGDVVGDLVVADRGLQFEGRSSPGLGGFVWYELKHSHTHTTLCGTQMSGHGVWGGGACTHCRNPQQRCFSSLT